MSPEVTAAIIAGCVGILTLIGTVIAQIVGFRSTGANTERQINAQREQLDTTLRAQSEQLKQTLEEQRTRTLNERFATAADQLGSDRPAVRLAGVYAMAGLADDWKEKRQTCVDVLCAYLRMPYEPDPGQNAPEAARLAFQASRQVRHTVIRVVTAHLKKDAAPSWQGFNFDFTGVVFDGGDFRGVKFSGGTVDFSLAHFPGGEVDFGDAEFSGGVVSFSGAEFSGGEVNFGFAHFSGGAVSFTGAQFSGGKAYFGFAHFSGGVVDFDGARLVDACWVGFTGAEFSGGTTHFNSVRFDGGGVDLSQAKFSGSRVYFNSAQFSGSTVAFSGAVFSDGEVAFNVAKFSGGTVYFDFAHFSGGTVRFDFAHFSGGTVDFSGALDWSTPPAFPWTDTPPSGVTLPRQENQSQA